MSDSQSIGWSFKASTNTGDAVQATSVLETHTVSKAKFSVAAGGTNEPFLLQLSNIAKIKFLSIVSSIQDGTITIKPDHADGAVVKLEGPLILFGESVALIGPTLNKLLATNTGPEDAEINILIGREL